MTVLQALFPPAAPLGTRTVSFINKGDDVIHFRHHSFDRKRKPDGSEDADVTEIGPRFNMRLYRLELGTLEMPDVKVEWALRPFMNKQKRVLADK
jgi:U3 small nucleolar ribonucleoprotein protein IMP4